MCLEWVTESCIVLSSLEQKKVTRATFLQRTELLEHDFLRYTDYLLEVWKSSVTFARHLKKKKINQHWVHIFISTYCWKSYYDEFKWQILGLFHLSIDSSQCVVCLMLRQIIGWIWTQDRGSLSAYKKNIRDQHLAQMSKQGFTFIPSRSSCISKPLQPYKTAKGLTSFDSSVSKQYPHIGLPS